MNDETLQQIDAKLNVLISLAIKAVSHDKNGDSRRPEELLASCGVNIDSIGAILGKNEAAIRKSLQRAGVQLRKRS
ncbi:MAG TPA: hypothetical protein VKV04_17030 [Verrucomicrobiae bacterium]|nr:hypothetical protein [Verrucomicrobiae bacterium]